VALAVRGDTSLHDRARKAGYQAVVVKPFMANDLLATVMELASAGASPVEVLKQYVSEDGGLPVFNLPNPTSKLLAKLLPIFAKKLRALAEDGNDKVILDLARVSDLTSENVAMLVRLLSDAGTLGIKTAICTPDAQMKEKLQQIAETSNTPYAASRDEARQCLQ
jgi:anti-anti-sigma regulatory factor